ncbi:hypothetical protein KP509_27G019400 [Ceratopteris richardii]|uniref:Uncharacterized protein n=1 Tax=Ceratopteris richardii TaxID=49495 RepID=A0A8T2RGW1_CERRI|nr:hypothetical protein KP509_27G019400 [Ceratopteris richardii]
MGSLVPMLCPSALSLCALAVVSISAGALFFINQDRLGKASPEKVNCEAAGLAKKWSYCKLVQVPVAAKLVTEKED